MAAIVSSFRYAVRSLRRSPGFAVVAILTLALGIGANTAIFSVINAVVFRSLPFERPEQLVVVQHHYPALNNLKGRVSVPGFLEYQRQRQLFRSVAVAAAWETTLTGRGDPERLHAIRVAGDYFGTFGVPPALGRGLTAEETARSVVVSDRLWRNAYGADRRIIGQRLVLDGESYEVVGVMPERFSTVLNRDIDLWVPLASTVAERSEAFGHLWLDLTARLQDGVTIPAAQASLHVLAQQIKVNRPGQLPEDWDIALSSLGDHVVSAGTRRAMFVLLGAVGLVLLIACANVASLQLARTASRSREIAIRVALGASRGDLVRQLLTESVLLGLLGGAFGLLLALWGVPALLALNANNLPPATAIEVDGQVLAFTLLLSLLTGLLFGLAPAMRISRTSVQEALKEGDRGAVGDRGGLALRRGLVVATVAVALTLLVGAGLLTRSFQQLLLVDPGFRTDHLLTFGIAIPESRYPSDTAQVAFFDQATAAMGAVPGVTAIGATSGLPFSSRSYTASFNVEGVVVPPNQNHPFGDLRVVTPGYLAALGAPLRMGRHFAVQDRSGAPLVAVVDEEMVKHFWPKSNPIGKRITFNDFADPVISWITVIGVVGHTMHEGLDGERRVQVYFPFAQAGRPMMTYAIRTSGEPFLAVNGLRAALKTVDPNVAIANVNRMDALVSVSTGSRRFSMALLTVFSLLATGLAAIGLYGVMSYTVTQRSRELGVRLALGATPAEVRCLVMRQGGRLACVGVGVGLIAAIALANALKLLDRQSAIGSADRLLFNVNPNDPTTFIGISVMLLAVTLLATWLPARRATGVDPVEALRGE